MDYDAHAPYPAGRVGAAFICRRRAAAREKTRRGRAGEGAVQRMSESERAFWLSFLAWGVSCFSVGFSLAAWLG